VRELTQREIVAIEQLQDLAKRWPDTLTIMAVAGVVHVLDKHEAMQGMGGEDTVGAVPIFGFSTMERAPMGDHLARAWWILGMDDDGLSQLKHMPRNQPLPEHLRPFAVASIFLPEQLEPLDVRMGLPTNPEAQA